MVSSWKTSFSGSTSPLVIVGAALFWAWMDAAVFSATLSAPGDNPVLFETVFITTTATTVVAFAVMVLRFREPTPFTNRCQVLVAVLACTGTVGSVIVAGGAGFHAGVVPVVVGSIAMGASFAMLNTLWGWVCVAQSHGKALVHIAGAWALGLPINLLLSLVPATIGATLVAALPLGSAAIYLYVARHQASPLCRIEQRAYNRVEIFHAHETIGGFDTRLLALIVVFCAIFGLMYANGFTANSVVGERGAYTIGLRGITALVFFVLGTTIMRDSVKTLFKLCFYVVAGGLAVMVVGLFVPSFYPISNALVATGYCGFDILVWTLVAFHGYVSANHPAKTVAIAMLAEQAGILTGAVAGVVLQLVDLDVTTRLVAMMALNMLAIVVLVGYTQYGSRLWSLLIKTSMASDEAFDKRGRYTDLAQRYGLTEREVQILSVFAEGRSMAYIADKLYVSENTVKTHVRHIYTKCGIHSKQELLDLVQTCADVQE